MGGGGGQRTTLELSYGRKAIEKAFHLTRKENIEKTKVLRKPQRLSLPL